MGRWIAVLGEEYPVQIVECIGDDDDGMNRRDVSQESEIEKVEINKCMCRLRRKKDEGGILGPHSFAHNDHARICVSLCHGCCCIAFFDDDPNPRRRRACIRF